MSLLQDPPELGHEAMVMHAGWSENVAQHRAWLQHLASAASAGRLLLGEVELLGQLVQPTSVEQWLAELRNLAARVPADGASATGQLRERLELLAEVAYAVRRATVSSRSLAGLPLAVRDGGLVAASARGLSPRQPAVGDPGPVPQALVPSSHRCDGRGLTAGKLAA